MYLRIGFERPFVRIHTLFFLVFLICDIYAIPIISLPIGSQIPPVAQANVDFNFTFSASTFISTTGALSYSLSNSPSWLLLDSNSRSLSGVPSKDDIGTTSFAIVANDNQGSTSLPISIAVVAENPLRVEEGVSQQLPTMGVFRYPDSLLLYPDSVFKLKFSENTFSHISSDTKYSAIGDDNTPLPAWISFNPEGLIFAGTTPVFTSQEELPQTIGIRLVASDLPGFSQASASFKLVIESHEMIFTQPQLAVSVEREKEFELDLAQYILRDNSPVSVGTITTIAGDFPSWLRVDNETLLLSGIVPGNFEDTNISVTVADSLGDTAMATLSLRVAAGTDNASSDLGYPQLIVAYIGKPFTYSFRKPNITEASLSVPNDTTHVAYPWIHFDNQTLEFSGIVPASESPRNITLILAATFGNAQVTRTIILELKPTDEELPSPGPENSEVSSSLNSMPTSPTPNIVEVASDMTRRRADNRRVILGVVFPFVFLFICLLIALLIMKRRKQLLVKEKIPDQHLEPEVATSYRRIVPNLYRNCLCSHIESRRLPFTLNLSQYKLGSSARNNQKGVKSAKPTTPPRIRPPRPPSDAPQIGRIILERDPDPLLSPEHERSLLESNLPVLFHEERPPSSIDSPTVNNLQKVVQKKPVGLANDQRDVSSGDLRERSMRYNDAKTQQEDRRLRNLEAAFTLSRPGSQQNDKRSTPANAIEIPDCEVPSSSVLQDQTLPNAGIDSSQQATNASSQLPESVNHKTRSNSMPMSQESDVSPTICTPLRKRRFQDLESSIVAASTLTEYDTSLTEDKDKLINRQSKRRSHILDRSNPNLRMHTSSVSKRSYRDSSSRLSTHLGKKRRWPQPSRFSNLSSDRGLSYSPQRHQVNPSSSEYTLSDTDTIDKENQEPEDFLQHQRRRSKVAVIRLGRQIQERAYSDKGSGSTRSRTSATSSEPSMSAIEKEFNESQDIVRCKRFFGSQQRSSLHRLSALPESQMNNDHEPEIKLKQKAIAMKSSEQSQEAQNSSVKGEIEEWEGCSSNDGGSEEKLFI